MIHCRTVVENPRRIFRRAIAALLLTATVAGGAAMAQDRLPGARDPVDQPFADNSIWNTPIGRGAQYQAADAAESRMLHTDDAGGHSGSYPWIGADAIGLYHARANDMVMRWLYNARSGSVPWPDGPPVTNGSVDLPTPAGVQFLGGSDGHAILIDPPGRYAYEVWQGAQAGQRAYRAVYLVRTDLRGSGIASGEGLSEGIRAFGGSLAGGIVRCSELAKGEIPHAVALLLSTTQLHAISRKGNGPDYPTYLLAAQNAQWDTTTHKWMLRHGDLHIIPDSSHTFAVHFDSSRDNVFTEPPANLTLAPHSPDEMRYFELGRYIAALERSGADANELKVERALKIAIPITCIIIAIFGAPLATSSQRGGAAFGVGISLAVTVIFLMLIQITKAVGQGGVIPPTLAAWLPNILFGALGALLLTRVRT